MRILSRILNKNRDELKEFAAYLAVGALTTLVNYAVYALLYRFAGLRPSIANAVAWVASVAFAYFANRRFVFHTQEVRGRAMAREAALFAAARILSFALEEAIVWIFAEKMGLNAYWVKLAANILVIVANYFASKLMIFRKAE